MRFAKPSSTRTGFLAAAVALAVAALVLAVFSSLDALSLAALVAALAAAAALALYLLAGERRRHERVEDALAQQASFLESLVESMGAIASTLDPAQVLEQARREAEELFGARGKLLPPGESPAADGNAATIPLRARNREIATLHLERDRPFDRGDLVRVAVLADFAARAADNAQLLAEAETRDAERERLSEQLITAEQDERRRLANELHDGAVQSMSGIALMLDAASGAIEAGRLDEARQVLDSALVRHRDTIRSLRDLSFSLEPVVLRDQGFGTAVKALAEQIALANRIQIIREALNQAIRRGPPNRVGITVRSLDDGGYAASIADDAPGERRRASFESIAERVRTLHGTFAVEQGADGGTTVQVLLPPYAERS